MDQNKRPESMVRITTPELAEAFIAEQVKAVQEQVGDKKVLLALSGGVDSSVVAALLIKAIGKQLVCVHVNHGLMRKGESENVIEVFKNQLDANLIYVDATDRFLDLLAGVSDQRKSARLSVQNSSRFSTKRQQSLTVSPSLLRAQSTLIFLKASSRQKAKRLSSLTTMSVVFPRKWKCSLLSLSSFSSRMR